MGHEQLSDFPTTERRKIETLRCGVYERSHIPFICCMHLLPDEHTIYEPPTLAIAGTRLPPTPPHTHRQGKAEGSQLDEDTSPP